jgi:hypothetical protein
MARVARERVVILTWDPETEGFWLTRDYFPQIIEHDRHIFPTPDELAQALGGGEAVPVPVPWDCTDGFLGAYWRRPEAYLDDGARGAISAFARIGVEAGLARLRDGLAGGAWARRNADLLQREELDLGYRLVIARR